MKLQEILKVKTQKKIFPSIRVEKESQMSDFFLIKFV